MGVASNILTVDQLRIINDFNSINNVLFGGSLSFNVFGVYKKRQIHDIDIIVTSQAAGDLLSVIEKYRLKKNIGRYNNNADGWTAQYVYKKTTFDIFHVNTILDQQIYIDYELTPSCTIKISHPMYAIDAKNKYISHPNTSAEHKAKHSTDINQYDHWLSNPAFYFYWNNRTSAPYRYEKTMFNDDTFNIVVVDNGICWSFDNLGVEEVVFISTMSTKYNILNKSNINGHGTYSLLNKISDVRDVLDVFNLNEIKTDWEATQFNKKL